MLCLMQGKPLYARKALLPDAAQRNGNIIHAKCSFAVFYLRAIFTIVVAWS